MIRVKKKWNLSIRIVQTRYDNGFDQEIAGMMGKSEGIHDRWAITDWMLGWVGKKEESGIFGLRNLVNCGTRKTNLRGQIMSP